MNNENFGETGSIRHSYTMTFRDGKSHTFNLDLSYPKLKQIKQERTGTPPEWTRLGFCRCQNCSLDPKTYEYCPAAECLGEIIEKFKDVFSVEEVDVVVTLPERIISKKLPVQKALSSMIGMYMATSDCPILSRFSPLARFHLPFSSIEETVYRAVSNYLLAQYFINKEGGKPDWDLEGLRGFYGEVEIVNKAICRRISSLCEKDANLNAVINLDAFARSLNELFDQFLERLKPLFSVQIKEAKR